MLITVENGMNHHREEMTNFYNFLVDGVCTLGFLTQLNKFDFFSSGAPTGNVAALFLDYFRKFIWRTAYL